MTKCRPVQKEKCVKVPREVIVQKEQKQCLPYEISQAEIDAQVKKASCAIGGKGTESINSIYPILHDTFKLSRPTIVFTQNICP